MGTALNKLVNKRAFVQQKESTEWPLASQLIGIELELENLQSASMRRHNEEGAPYWVMHEDHSLRGGTEWVLRDPMMGMELSKAISYFFKTFKGIGKSSLRASTHIHINMLQDEDTIEVLRNMTALYYAIEDAMYSCISSSRKWAVYAAPLGNRVPTDVSTLFSKDLSSGHWVNTISQNTREAGGGRYYGFNLKAMSRFGTIEFRHFPAVTTEDELRSWVRLVMELKSAAVTIDSSGQTIKDFLATEEAFDKLAELMPEWGPQLLRSIDRVDSIGKVQSLYELMPLAARYSQDLEALDTNPIVMRMPKPANNKPSLKTKKLRVSVPTESMNREIDNARDTSFWDGLWDSQNSQPDEMGATRARAVRAQIAAVPARLQSTTEDPVPTAAAQQRSFDVPIKSLQETTLVPLDIVSIPQIQLTTTPLEQRVPVSVRDGDFGRAKVIAEGIVATTAHSELHYEYWMQPAASRQELRDSLIELVGQSYWISRTDQHRFRMLFFAGLVRGMFPQYLTYTN